MCSITTTVIKSSGSLGTPLGVPWRFLGAPRGSLGGPREAKGSLGEAMEHPREPKGTWRPSTGGRLGLDWGSTGAQVVPNRGPVAPGG